MFFGDVAPVYSKRNNIYVNKGCVYKIMDRDSFFLIEGQNIVLRWSFAGRFYKKIVRLVLLALSVVLEFAQAVVDNSNNTSLTPFA